MANLIEQRVEMARNGQNPFVICKMKSGCLVIGDVQPLPGYCVLLADPLAESLNALDAAARTQCSLDVIAAGYAVLAWVGYDWPTSRKFDPVRDGPFVERMRRHRTGASA